MMQQSPTLERSVCMDACMVTSLARGKTGDRVTQTLGFAAAHDSDLCTRCYRLYAPHLKSMT